MISRRHFVSTLSTAVAATTFAGPKKPRLKIGFDNFAVRAMGWKAPQLLDYAVKLGCDALFISDLTSYESIEDGALREFRKRSDDLGIGLYTGGWSICPTSASFRKDQGTAQEHLTTGIRLAKALGSPVYRVILGTADDRKSDGGIRARMADTVKALRPIRQLALDSGIKIAIENHAGDMHSWELRDLVEEAGTDFVGVNMDSGNAAWTLEDPQDVLDNLGKYVVCSSLRDIMIWETPDGANVQWTAVGEGLIDWKRYTDRWAMLCPQVPVMIETISGFARNFPYKKDRFWAHYDRREDALRHFETLANRGKLIPPFTADGPDKKKQEQEYQKSELERSLKYLREVVGLGLKSR